MTFNNSTNNLFREQNVIQSTRSNANILGIDSVTFFSVQELRSD